MAAYLGGRCKVVVAGYTLRYVRGVSLDAPADGLVTLRVEIVGGFSYNDGVFELDIVERPKPEATGRAISLTGVPLGE